MKMYIIVCWFVIIAVAMVWFLVLLIKEKINNSKIKKEYEEKLKEIRADEKKKKDLQNQVSQHSSHTDNIVESLNLVSKRKADN